MKTGLIALAALTTVNAAAQEWMQNWLEPWSECNIVEFAAKDDLPADIENDKDYRTARFKRDAKDVDREWYVLDDAQKGALMDASRGVCTDLAWVNQTVKPSVLIHCSGASNSLRMQFYAPGTDCTQPWVDATAAADQPTEQWIEGKQDFKLQNGRDNTWRAGSDGGFNLKMKASFTTVRQPWVPKPAEDDDSLPRPAVSNQARDRIASIDVFSDSSCSEQWPMNEGINPYKLLHDLNDVIARFSDPCQGPMWAESNGNMLKIQGFLDNANGCPRKPGLIHLLGGSGDCVPLVGYNSATMQKDGGEGSADDHGAADDFREKSANMWVKFTLRDKLSEGVSHETDFMLLAILIVAVILSCFVCICVAILLAQNMRK